MLCFPTRSSVAKVLALGANCIAMRRHALPPQRVIRKKPQLKQAIAPKTTAPLPTVQSDTSRVLPRHFPPTEVFRSADGTQAELLRIGLFNSTANTPDRADDRLPHTHIVLLPGNPGVVEYYRVFLRTLWQRLPRSLRHRVHMHALGLPGHDLVALNGRREFTIQEHVAFTAAYLRSPAVRPALPKAHLVLVGHSYGSFLALRTLEVLCHAADADEIAARTSLVMLMPCVWQMAVCAGPLMRTLIQYRTLSAPLTWLVTALAPPALRDAVLDAMAYSDEARDVSARIVDGKRSLYNNIMALATDEMREIRNPQELPAVRALRGQALLLYADEDKWCPEEARTQIVEAFGDVEVAYTGDGVRHAFVLTDFETTAVVEAMRPWLLRQIGSS